MTVTDPIQCDYCRGTGWILSVPDKGPYSQAGRMVPCSCLAGQKMLLSYYPPNYHGYMTAQAARGRDQADERTAEAERIYDEAMAAKHEGASAK